MASLVKRQPPGCPEPVYYYHETYRVKVNGQGKGKGPGSGKSKVRSRDVYLGTARQVLEKLRRAQQPQEIDAKEFGLVCAALDVAEEIGIVEVIDRLVPKRRQGLTVGQYLLIGILNKIAHPTSRRGIKAWFEKTVLPQKLGIDPNLLTSQNFWDHFDLILPEAELKERKARVEQGELAEAKLFDDKVIDRIEEGVWANVLRRYRIPLDSVIYDATNFFSFIDGANARSWLAKRGYNKHGRHNLRQFGLLLAATRSFGLPLFHVLYEGRRHEAKLFPESMTDLVERYLALRRGTQQLTVVFDKGNNSAENLQYAVEQLKLRVVGSLVAAHHPDLTGVRLSRYREEVDGKPVFRTEKEVFGIAAAVAVVYNEATARRQKRRLRAEIDQLRAEVKAAFAKHQNDPKPEIERAVEDVLADRPARRYLDVRVEGRRFKRLVCRVNRKTYDARLRTLGKTILFSNDRTIPTEALVRLYTEKATIEADFRQMNDPDAIAFRPVYHWTDTKVKVYALMCVLALLVLQLMNLRARQAGLVMSNAVLREELSDIREVAVIFSPAQVVRRVTRMSPIQEKFFEVFSLGRFAPT